MRIKSVLAVLLVATGCTMGGEVLMKPIPQPAEGFKAVKFKEFIAVKDHSINTYSFGAGSILINDRQMDGAPYYCGVSSVNNTSGEFCHYFDGNTLVIAYGTFKEVRRDLTGKIEHIRVKL